MSKNPLYVEISIKENLDERWQEWFQGLTLFTDLEGSSRLTGEVADQPALYSVLECIRNLNLTLVSVQVKEIAF